MVRQDDGNWGDFYFGKKKNSWGLELIHKVNTAVPRFDEVFDEDTFYMTALLVTVSTFILAFFMSRMFPIRLRDSDL